MYGSRARAPGVRSAVPEIDIRSGQAASAFHHLDAAPHRTDQVAVERADGLDEVCGRHADAERSTGGEDDLAFRMVLPIHGDFVPIPVDDSPEPKIWRGSEVPEIQVVTPVPERRRVHRILEGLLRRRRCAVAAGVERIDGLGRIESPL